MKHKVLIIDTSMLVVYLQVPGMDSCGPDADRWNYLRVKQKIDVEIAAGTKLILPLATIIETGNHIAQAGGHTNFDIASAFCEYIILSADGESPWMPMDAQVENLWSRENLKRLAQRWPALAATKHSMGDATIVDVAKHF